MHEKSVSPTETQLFSCFLLRYRRFIHKDSVSIGLFDYLLTMDEYQKVDVLCQQSNGDQILNMWSQYCRSMKMKHQASGPDHN